MIIFAHVSAFVVVLVIIGGTVCLKKISQKSRQDALSKLEADASNLLSSAKEIRAIFSNPQSAQASNEKLFIVSMIKRSVFINGVEIISSRARLQFAIFEVLFNHFKEHYFEQKTLFLNTQQIIKLLIENKTTKWITESKLNPIQIIQAIEKIKLSAFEKLNNKIIVSEKWKGYAINSNVMVKKGGV